MKKYIKADLKTKNNSERYELYFINKDHLKNLDIVKLIKTFVSVAIKSEEDNLVLMDCIEVCRRPSKGVFVVKDGGDYWVHRTA